MSRPRPASAFISSNFDFARLLSPVPEALLTCLLSRFLLYLVRSAGYERMAKKKGKDVTKASAKAAKKAKAAQKVERKEKKKATKKKDEFEDDDQDLESILDQVSAPCMPSEAPPIPLAAGLQDQGTRMGTETRAVSRYKGNGRRSTRSRRSSSRALQAAAQTRRSRRARTGTISGASAASSSAKTGKQ